MQNQSSLRWKVNRFALPIAMSLASFALNLHAAKVPEGEPRALGPDIVIHANQVAYDVNAPKFAIIESAQALPADTAFQSAASSDC